MNVESDNCIKTENTLILHSKAYSFDELFLLLTDQNKLL